MRKYITFSFLFITIALFFLAGCNSASQITSKETLGIVVPEPEPLGPVDTQVDFEDTVKGKVWYTKLQGDENLDNLYQIKIQFNTASKTFTKETYKWERYGRTNKYKYAGLNFQKADYFFGLAGNTIEYELRQDYNVSANSSRMNNSIDETRKTALYVVESPERIVWDGNLYILKQAMERNLISDYTNKREFEIK